MIEFVLSRAWMFIAALAITVVVVGAFNAMDRDVIEQSTLEKAESFAELIRAIGSHSIPGEITVAGRDFMPDGSITMTLRNGSMWVGGEHISKVFELPNNVIYRDKGSLVDKLEIKQKDFVRISCSMKGDGSTFVQVEKVEATCFTASTNLLASSSVL